MATFWAWTSMIVLLLLGLFLMIIVLLQRGRGGGLAGAFGGMGGQSAFGTKAGDVFTKITIVVALFWVGMAGLSGFVLRAAAERQGAAFGDEVPAAVSEDPEIPSAAEVPESPQPPAGASGDAPAGTEDGAAGPDLGSPAVETPATDAEPAASDGDSSESTETPEPGETSDSQN